MITKETRNTAGLDIGGLCLITAFAVASPMAAQESMPNPGQISDSIFIPDTLIPGITHDTVGIQYLVPAYVDTGDLLLMRLGDPYFPYNLFYWDHAAIYIGGNHFIHSIGAETGYPGVCIVDYTFFKTCGWATDLTFFKVSSASNWQKIAAVEWAHERLGDLYQYSGPGQDYMLKCANPYLSWPTADEWYCSELVWAAYYNQGIDIDRNGWSPFPFGVPAVPPDDIARDNDIEQY